MRENFYNTLKKGKILALVLSLICFQGIFAQVDRQVQIDFPGEEEAMKAAKETVKAYETANWDMLRSHLGPDAVFYNLGSYDSLNVDQTIEYWKKGRELATPVLSDDGAWLPVSVPEGPRKGNWILHWGSNTLSYPTGETITFPYHVALKFENEKVEEAHFYYDNNKIIRALGYEIQPPLTEGEEDDEEVKEDNGKL